LAQAVAVVVHQYLAQLFTQLAAVAVAVLSKKLNWQQFPAHLTR
jgi:hypothetical protein